VEVEGEEKRRGREGF